MEEESMKEVYAKKYFNDIKLKHLKHFKTKTPQGNEIEGFICKKRNHFLGSMVIDKITDTHNVIYPVEQFIHAMPKINYYSYKNKMYMNDKEESEFYPCYEKLDGSCLILYGLYDGDRLIEVVPKTRGLPVADKHIVEMYNEIDHSNIESFFENYNKNNPTLIFELYGQLNQHSIYYPEVRISLSFIGLSINGVLEDHNMKEFIAKQYDFNLPRVFFALKYNEGFWRVAVTPGVHSHYLLKGMTDAQKEGLKVEYPTQLDAINTVKDYLDIINKSYAEVHNYSLTEGVCVNTYDYTGENFMYLKIKPSAIHEKLKKQNGIPRKFILKEVQKYFDEYGSQAKEIYKKDEDHAYNYIVGGLSEEFDKDDLENKKTKNRIRTVFLDMLESKEPPKGLQDICHEIVEQYPGQDPVDYIRLFAQEYPEKKRQANMAFTIFERLAAK